MNLHDVFSSIVVKRLIDVDLPNRSSRQHEINGIAPLRHFFNTHETKKGSILWYLFKDEQEIIHMEEGFTFYDARAANPSRTEWRFYYQGNFLSNANPGDVLILVRKHDELLYGLIFQNRSSWLRIAISLFGLGEISNEYRMFNDEQLENRPLELGEQLLLDELGIEYEIIIPPQIEDIAQRELEANAFEIPTTHKLSEIAWNNCRVNIEDSDSTLIAWLQFETEIFYAMERLIVQPRLTQGFITVEDFITYSLTVQNRRKSRRGYSFQNHLEKLFGENELHFSSQALTEDKNRPDFIFPGQKEYTNRDFDSNFLIMLAAKSSCKERWRQILNEANRIPRKHLCTLERSLTIDQMNQMRTASLTLVIPEAYHSTFAEEQREEIWTIRQFIEFVRASQSH